MGCSSLVAGSTTCATDQVRSSTTSHSALHTKHAAPKQLSHSLCWYAVQMSARHDPPLTTVPCYRATRSPVQKATVCMSGRSAFVVIPLDQAPLQLDCGTPTDLRAPSSPVPAADSLSIRQTSSSISANLTNIHLCMVLSKGCSLDCAQNSLSIFTTHAHTRNASRPRRLDIVLVF